jgi:two-component system OmpR family sensor kinase/two-component system sensor histidine kinase BaeS
VLYDSAHELETRRLSARQLDNGYPIVDPESDEVVGYLLLSLPMPNQLGPLETQFLDRLQRLVAIGVAISVTLALIVSAVFSRTLTAPLRDLADAAKAVAAGDFRQRVPVQGSTEIAQVAKNFNEMTKALEQGEQLRKNMVADVAHELRTPVSVLQGNLRAILDQVYPLSEAEIARLYDETRLLGRLIDDLRELAQADAGQLTLHTQRIAIEPWLRNHVQKFAPAADLKHIDLQLEIQPDLPSLHGDPDRLAEVISNLLNNALRHTPEGGQITVSTQRSPQSPEAIEVTVEDTGKGIAPEDLPHIFDRFWRADRSRSRAYGGSGLGLAIAQSLIKAHGGRIWAESSLGQGSRFTVWLPLT